MEIKDIINAQEKQLTVKASIENYDQKEHSIVFIISDGSIDHQEEIVNPKGMFFRKQPKGLYAHDYYIPAVTKLDWVKYDSAANNIKSKFVFDQNDPFAVLLESKYANGFMTDVSIGFMTDLDALTFNDGIIIHNIWELIEVSLVNIGANLNAVALTIDECNTLTKSKEINTNPKLKNMFEDLKYRVMAKDIKDEVIKSLENKFTGIDTDIKNFKETIEALKSTNSSNSNYDSLVKADIKNMTLKYNKLAQEINKLKVWKNKSELKSVLGS
jgi:archaellum component FlaC